MGKAEGIRIGTSVFGIEKGGIGMKIAYQNKDVACKTFGEKLVGKSLKVYGLNIPKIVKVLPTNLPAIQANEFRIDNLFLLEDGTVAIIDYESAYKKENKLKYISYISRVLERYKEAGELEGLKLRMIVIYTADVSRDETEDVYDVGPLQLTVESAYLSELDSKDIMQRLQNKVKAGISLTDEEMLEFIILPLTYKEKERKRHAIKDVIDLAKGIKDQQTSLFILSGIVVFTDKVIDDETRQSLKEWLGMTKIGQMFAEEAAVERARADAAETRADEEKKRADAAEAELKDLKQKLKEFANL